MKYLFYILLFLAPFLSYVVWKKFQHTIRKILIQNTLLSMAYKKTQNHHLCLFNDILIEMASKCLMKASYKKQKKILEDLKNGNTEKLFEYTRSQEENLNFALNHILPSSAPYHIPPKNSKNKNSKLISAIIHECTFEYPSIKEDLKQTPFLILSQKNRIIRQLLSARCLFLQTDLQNASKLLLKTVQKLRKLKLYNELAYAYYMLGEIYRVAGLHDIAEMMLTSSLQIYKNTNHKYGQTFITAIKGLNCIDAKRFEDAQNYLNQALKIYTKNKDKQHEAEILNQMAILLNTKGTFQEAYINANKALKKHKFCNNISGLALSYQQMAISAYNMENFKTAEKYAEMAKKNYQLHQNHAALTESLELLTRICIKKKNLKKAKKYLNALKYRKKRYHQYFSLENLKKLSQDINAEKVKTK